MSAASQHIVTLKPSTGPAAQQEYISPTQRCLSSVRDDCATTKIHAQIHFSDIVIYLKHIVSGRL